MFGTLMIRKAVEQMSTLNHLEIFKELCALAEGDLSDQLPERIEELENLGFVLKVETHHDEPDFIADPNTYTEVIQHCELWIGESKVYEWEETYWGSFGGMGAGWWVEQGDTSIDFDVMALMELLEMLPEAPDVPKPESQDADD